MTDFEIVTSILRGIQATLAEHGRKLDVLAADLRSLAHQVVDVKAEMGRLKVSTVSYDEFNKLVDRVSALEASHEDKALASRSSGR